MSRTILDHTRFSSNRSPKMSSDDDIISFAPNLNKFSFTAEELIAVGDTLQRSLLPPSLYYADPKKFAGRKLTEDARLTPPANPSARFLKPPPPGYRRQTTPERHEEYLAFRRKQIPHLMKVKNNRKLQLMAKHNPPLNLQSCQPTTIRPSCTSPNDTPVKKQRSDSGYMSNSPVDESSKFSPIKLTNANCIVVPPSTPENRLPLYWSASWFMPKSDEQEKHECLMNSMEPTSSNPEFSLPKPTNCVESTDLAISSKQNRF